MVSITTTAQRLGADSRATRDNLRAFPGGPGCWTVPSGTLPAVYYELRRRVDGGYTCTCPAGAEGRGCKHVSAVMAQVEGERDATPVAVEAVAPGALFAAERPRRPVTAEELAEAKRLLLGEPKPIAGGQDVAAVPPHAADQVVIPKRFWIERQGREFVLFAGLLDCAHRLGLESIETDLLQRGDDENGQTWIVRAVVTMDRGRRFSGHGDASPVNVARAMLAVLPRLAETRAVARALRLAVNVGTAAVEELLEDGSAQEPRPVLDERVTPVPDGLGSRSVADDVPRASGGATVAQLRAISSIGASAGMDADYLDNWSRELHGVPVAELSRKQASDCITRMKGAPRGGGSAPQWAGTL